MKLFYAMTTQEFIDEVFTIAKQGSGQEQLSTSEVVDELRILKDKALKWDILHRSFVETL
tara:strand:+ start:54 stop:233 length:180 start_codon:yes stop_codon:yes gene_type:complete